MGQAKIEIYCHLNADILTNILQKCLLHQAYHFRPTSKFDWLPWQPKYNICEKIFKINSSEAIFGDKAETLLICLKY